MRRLRRSDGKRPRWILPVAAVVVLVAGLVGGWVLAGAFVSPAQREASATPPPPGILTVTVERGDLADTVSVTSTITREDSTTVALAGSEESFAVVTARPVKPGGAAKARKVVLEVSGRPVFLVTGRFPFYRPMRVGDSGPDIRQLQKALKVKADGRFGSRTASAVRELYRKAGYPPPLGPSEDSDDEHEVLIVPPSEFAVVSGLPARVASAPVVGTVLDGESNLVIESGAVLARASIPGPVQARLVPGMTATLDLPDGSIDLVVDSIGEPDAESGEAELLLTAAQDAAPIPEDVLGTEAVVVITIELLRDDALLVPSSAVVPAGDASPFVEVVRNGTRERVGVRELATLDGVSAIEPVDGGLDVGDLVRVG